MIEEKRDSNAKPVFKPKSRLRRCFFCLFVCLFWAGKEERGGVIRNARGKEREKAYKNIRERVGEKEP